VVRRFPSVQNFILELQAAFSRSIRKRFHTAMVEQSVAVEHNVLNIFFESFLRQDLPDDHTLLFF